MFRSSVCLFFLFFALSEAIVVKQYADASCNTLVSTATIALGACIDSSSGGSQSSMSYKVCNSTNVEVWGYANNNCGGSSMFSLKSAPGVCQNQMVIVCDTAPTPPPAPPTTTQNGWIVTIKSYSDNNCQTLTQTTTATVGSCKDLTQGQSASSGLFLSCSNSTVSGNMFANNNCAGIPVATLSSPLDKCDSREIVSCVAPSGKSSASNMTVISYLFFFMLCIFLIDFV